MQHEKDSVAGAPSPRRRWLAWLGRLRRDTRGASLIEQVLIMAVAVVGMVGFSRFGSELHEQLDHEAQHVRGRGAPGSELSLGALASSYQPELPSRGTASGARPAPGSGRATSAASSTPSGAATAPNGSAATNGTATAPNGSAAPRGAASATPNGSAAPNGAATASNGAATATAPNASAAVPNRAAAAGAAALPSASSSGGGPSGTPGASAGGVPPRSSRPDLECGDSGRYQADLGANSRSRNAPRVPEGSDLERDHIPQGHSLRVRAGQLLDAEITRRVQAQMAERCRDLTPEEEARIVSAVVQETAAAVSQRMNAMVENRGFTVALPHPFHEQGRTHSNASLAASEAGDLAAAARADMQHYLDILDDEVRRGSISAECAGLLRKVFAERAAVSKAQYDAELQKIMLTHLQKKSGTLNTSLKKQFEQEAKCQ